MDHNITMDYIYAWTHYTNNYIAICLSMIPYGSYSISILLVLVQHNHSSLDIGFILQVYNYEYHLSSLYTISNCKNWIFLLSRLRFSLSNWIYIYRWRFIVFERTTPTLPGDPTVNCVSIVYHLRKKEKIFAQCFSNTMYLNPCYYHHLSLLMYILLSIIYPILFGRKIGYSHTCTLPKLCISPYYGVYQQVLMG